MLDLWNSLIFPAIFIFFSLLFFFVFLLTRFKLSSGVDHGPRERLQRIAMNIMFLSFLILNGSSYNPELGGVFTVLIWLVPVLTIIIVVVIVVQLVRFVSVIVGFPSDEG